MLMANYAIAIYYKLILQERLKCPAKYTDDSK